ncbi:MAG TPA: HEAT repeat domain-containing protein [Polyangia bacterium]
MRRLILLLVLVLAALPACDDRSYREIGAAINVLAKKSEELPGPAIARLKQIGRRAVPQIETAMHTASPRGKVNLVSALAAIGEPESTAILQHFAVYDKSPEVRAACEDLLAQWAASNDRKGQPAQQAMARVQEKRKLGLAE